MPEIPEADVDRLVVGVIVRSLNSDPANVLTESSLQMDLGAESIDVMDIVFRVEQQIRAIAHTCGVVLPKSSIGINEFAAKEFDGMMTADQQRHLAESGFPGLMKNFEVQQAPAEEQKVSCERWDGTAPGTVGRLQVIAKRMAQPQQAE